MTPGKFDIIVAADERWGIGRHGGIPWHSQPDLAHFSRVTKRAPDYAAGENAVIMGRLTHESIGRALPQRLNIVISSSWDRLACPMIGVSSFEEALDSARRGLFRPFVIGGARLYVAALAHPDLEYIYLTRVAGEYDCDVSIPNLDEITVPDPAWIPVDVATVVPRVRFERRVRRSA